MIAGILTFGDLINWHPHIHALVPEGAFLPSGAFCQITRIDDVRFKKRWESKVFAFLKKAGLLTEDDIEKMRKWKHSGFSVDTSVRIEAGDKPEMMRLIQYIIRIPFSLERMVKVTDDGKVLYQVGKGVCVSLKYSLFHLQKLSFVAKSSFSNRL